MFGWHWDELSRRSGGVLIDVRASSRHGRGCGTLVKVGTIIWIAHWLLLLAVRLLCAKDNRTPALINDAPYQLLVLIDLPHRLLAGLLRQLTLHFLLCLQPLRRRHLLLLLELHQSGRRFRCAPHLRRLL